MIFISGLQQNSEFDAWNSSATIHKLEQDNIFNQRTFQVNSPITNKEYVKLEKKILPQINMGSFLKKDENNI